MTPRNPDANRRIPERWGEDQQLGALEGFQVSDLPEGGDFVRDVRWVGRQLALRAHGETVETETCPSSLAFGMLSWCLERADNRSYFWMNVYMKLAPSKAELELEDRYADDGRDTFRLIEDFRRAGLGGSFSVLSVGAQDPVGEPSIPQAVDPGDNGDE